MTWLTASDINPTDSETLLYSCNNISRSRSLSSQALNPLEICDSCWKKYQKSLSVATELDVREVPDCACVTAFLSLIAWRAWFICIRPFTKWLVRAHPVHSEFRLSEPVDCYVNNLKKGVILSYINDEIKIVAIQKSVLYNDCNLVIILSTFFSPENDRRKRLSRFCKRYLQYYEVRDQFLREMPTKMMISCLLNVKKIWNSAQINWSWTLNFYRKYFFLTQ